MFHEMNGEEYHIHIHQDESTDVIGMLILLWELVTMQTMNLCVNYLDQVVIGIKMYDEQYKIVLWYVEMNSVV